MIEDKISGLIGLALRQGAVSVGTNPTLDLIRKKKAELVLLDKSASENTKKRLQNACEHYEVPLYYVNESLIEKASGKVNRMAVAFPKGNGISKEILKLAGGLDTLPPDANTEVQING
ncbi:MAG: ribosomal L7Ae/L30e/S12e/Gadd45 family protein [Eubacteriales bacterium]|nr:ribosomal L7Ae/L30e/S12e/Gadd45 family protein [Eubacteriales bacterium]